MNELNQALETALRQYWNAIPREDVEVEFVESPFNESVCPVCCGMGFYTIGNIPPGHPQFGKPQRCTNPDCAAARESARRALRNYALPEEYQKLDFVTWQKRVQGAAWQGKRIAYEAAVLFATNETHEVDLAEACDKAGYEGDHIVKRSLAFYGPVGVGKTGLAAAIMNHLGRQSKAGVIYIRAGDFFMDLQDAFNDKDKADDANERSFAERLRKYQSASVLILDEWRMQKMTESRLQWMEELMRYRHGRRLPTIITTNLDPDAIYDHWTEQTADVALEMAHWIQVGGEKLRETRGGIREF